MGCGGFTRRKVNIHFYIRDPGETVRKGERKLDVQSERGREKRQEPGTEEDRFQPLHGEKENGTEKKKKKVELS